MRFKQAKTPKEKKLNYEMLTKDLQTRNEYKKTVTESLNGLKMKGDANKDMEELILALKGSANQTVPEMAKRNKEIKSEEMVHLREIRDTTYRQYKKSSVPEDRKKYQARLNNIKKETKRQEQLEEEKKWNEILKSIEETENDSFKMFKALKILNIEGEKKKKSIMGKNKNGSYALSENKNVK